MKAQSRLLWPFLAGVLFTLCCGVIVWLAARTASPGMIVSAKAQDIYQVPARGTVCATGIFQGVYVFTVEGVLVNGDAKQNYAGLGVLALDGQGGALLRITQSYDGRIVAPTTLAGRFVLGEDCAGQLLFNSGARFDFASDNGGRELRLLQTNPNNVVQGTARRQ